MKYLKSFGKQLGFFRETHKLSLKDIADLCALDESVVKAWESSSESAACYPSLENLLDICFKTGAALEYFLDIPSSNSITQLELPGVTTPVSDGDLSKSISELDAQMAKVMPNEKELELLRKFRKSNEQNKELILKLAGS